MSPATIVLLSLLALIALLYAGYWIFFLTQRRQWQWPTWYQAYVGFITDFLDTLGIGSFAITTALYRPYKSVDDRLIPGTLNVGHALPTVAQAFFFINAVQVDALTLWLLILASVIGAWFGASVVARLPKAYVQLGMGCALLCAAIILLARQLSLIPDSGTALGLEGTRLVVGILGNIVFGALMTIGVGAYAPIMVMVSLLGMNPTTAFPIMMGSCAFLMPAASMQFIRSGSYSVPAALGLTLLGIPGVIIAAVFVKSLNLYVVQWLVLCVVIYTGLMMLAAGRKSAFAPRNPDTVADPSA